MSSTHRHTSTARKRGKGSVTSSRRSKSNGKGRTTAASRSGAKAKSGGNASKKKKAASKSSRASSSNGRKRSAKKKASSSSSSSRKGGASTTKKKAAAKAKGGSKGTSKSKAKAPANKAKAPTKKAKSPASKAKAPAKKAKAPAKKAKAPAKKAKAPASKPKPPAKKAKTPSKAPASKPASKAKAPSSKAKAPSKPPASKAKAPATPQAKAPSKAAPAMGSFDVGDKAVHPAHGVGEITSIESRDIAGTRKAFYILKILDTGMTVMVPTDGAERLGLRKVISRDDAKKVLAILQKNEIAVTSQPWNRRYREYMDMLKSGSPYEVAKVLRDLYRLKGDKELSFGERRLLEQARTLLVTELALARRCKEQTVEDEIEGILSA